MLWYDFLKMSLFLWDTLHNNIYFSDKYETLYPYATQKRNEGSTTMFTKEQIEEMNVVTEIVSWFV